MSVSGGTTPAVYSLIWFDKLTMSEFLLPRPHSSIRRDVSMKLVTSSGPSSVMSTASSMW